MNFLRAVQVATGWAKRPPEALAKAEAILLRLKFSVPASAAERQPQQRVRGHSRSRSWAAGDLKDLAAAWAHIFSM